MSSPEPFRYRPVRLDAQEITDEGSLNQRAILAHRAPLVEELYGNPGRSAVIVL